jgi:DNA modification methylase
MINQVIQGDCLIEMQKIGDKSIDMILCDLPYGTTGVACKNLNRNFILIEKEPEYIDIINKRLNETPDKLL